MGSAGKKRGKERKKGGILKADGKWKKGRGKKEKKGKGKKVKRRE